ncbi:hypothetical protein, partial [Tritonibacter sp. SIMBA_163]|uniref:hypothetical protein n=1 Tax=Tritonibacter sp. SIMBA_163 TaxID=3080868 RepID=UPI00397F523E
MTPVVQSIYLIGSLVLKMWDRLNVKAGELPDESEVQAAEELRRALLKLAANEASEEPTNGNQQDRQGKGQED